MRRVPAAVPRGRRLSCGGVVPPRLCPPASGRVCPRRTPARAACAWAGILRWYAGTSPATRLRELICDGTSGSEGQAVRVVPCVIVTACFGLLLAGCSSTNRRSGGGGSSDTPFMGARSQGNGRASEPTDPILQSGGTAPNLDGVLAGQVIDLTTGRATSASIRWVCLDDGKGAEANIDVATDERGYFVIQGLKAGKHYKLIAQSKQGDRVLSGVTYKIA